MGAACIRDSRALLCMVYDYNELVIMHCFWSLWGPVVFRTLRCPSGRFEGFEHPVALVVSCVDMRVGVMVLGQFVIKRFRRRMV